MSTPYRYAASLSAFTPYQGKGGLVAKILQFVNILNITILQ